jgi:hypothetical protein
MTVTLQCSCGHRHSITEATQDTALERAAVYLKLKSYPPCSVCGQQDWEIVEKENPMSGNMQP